MKTLSYISIFLFASTLVCAQTDTTERRPIFSDIKQDSSEISIQTDHVPVSKSVEVSKSSMPRKLVDALEKEKQYKGWEKFPVYQDSNTKLYLVRVQHGNSIRKYGLNENGKPVTFSEATVTD